jgi:hypothetical protein
MQVNPSEGINLGKSRKNSEWLEILEKRRLHRTKKDKKARHFSCRPAIEKHTDRTKTNPTTTERAEGR